uniref:Uncharacterized protein n=1 Tax=Ditylenchus dipsaci TaxID=166011 RepID=A0A915E7U0_9BILA
MWIPYNFLRFFLDDDEQLEDIKKQYSSGKLLTSELKKITIDLLSNIVAELQTRRKEVSDETVTQFTKVHELCF